jgi:hypothetical protein
MHNTRRASGCLREALAVASTRLLPLDPAAQQLRQQYTASITPAAPATVAAGVVKPHPEAAAANLLLLDQPAAAARALASRDGGCNALALHVAARTAVLAAAHKVCVYVAPQRILLQRNLHPMRCLSELVWLLSMSFTHKIYAGSI